jgi:hypothetical protein
MYWLKNPPYSICLHNIWRELPLLVEKIGRKLVIIIGAAIIILGVFLQSFANGLVMVRRIPKSEPSNDSNNSSSSPVLVRSLVWD